MRIQLTGAILMPRLAEFLRNSTIDFRMFLYLGTRFPRVAVSLLCRSQARTISSLFTNQIGKNLNMIFDTACDRHSNETVTLGKHATIYKIVRKCIVEFLSKSESRGIKIALINSIRITKAINLLEFCSVGVGCHRGRFSLHSQFIEKPIVLFNASVHFVSWRQVLHGFNYFITYG